MKPRSLMFTLYGEYIQYYGGEIWTGSLIRMMLEFGISESSVRGAILRMVQQDFVQVKKIGNKSYYSLTAKGKRNIEDGVRRVYSVRNHKWDGNWRILTYSVPEEKRDLRDQIRKELNWMGFGLISSSTWISPNPLEDQIMELINDYNLREYIILFTSSAIVSHNTEQTIEKGWNLEEIEKEYDQFIEKYKQKLTHLQEMVWNDSLTDQQCFLERTSIVHEYRKFLFKDPGFPLDLLPQDWSGNKARELFWNIHQLVSIRAVRYFELLFEPSPDGNYTSNREKVVNPFSEIF